VYPLSVFRSMASSLNPAVSSGVSTRIGTEPTAHRKQGAGAWMRGSRRGLGALLLGGLALSPLHAATVPVSQAIGTCTTANPNPNPNPASFAAVNDFNGDCRSDLLWQKQQQWRGLPLVHERDHVCEQREHRQPTFDWVIQGVGDFNGDGKADILWRNSSTGEVYLWITSGTMFSDRREPWLRLAGVEHCGVGELRRRRQSGHPGGATAPRDRSFCG